MASRMKVETVVTGMQPARVVAQIQSNINDGLETVAPLLTGTAQALVPVRTGELRDSITAKVYREKGILILSAGPLKTTHPRFIEYGTVHNKPTPFIRRTMKLMKPTIEAVLKSNAKRPVA
jgi:HK97 gp10 family phage protein